MDLAGEWRLYLLGDFRLLRGADQLHLSTRKAASLLAYSALHPAGHSREHLATLLWGDYPDNDARRSLRVALVELRAALGNDAIMASRDTAQLNPTFPLHIDAVTFREQAASFLAAPEVELPATFVDLYRGDLLPDFDHEWIVPERERLRSLFLNVLLRIAQEQRARGEYEQAIGAAQHILALEPSNERAHQHLMFCQMARGDRSAALQQYDACRRALQEDLGVEPLPETERLYTWIKGQPEHAPAKEARISNLPVPLTSFVGRKQELNDCLDMLHRPDVRLLSVTGAGGSGKTRLALEAASAVVPEYPHGVFFIDLASLRQADLLPSAIARRIGVQAVERQPLTGALLDFLREKQMLLLLDNFEQIIEAAPLLMQLLQVAPKLKLMVTSRAALRLTAEQEYPILPLQTPDLQRLPDLLTLSQYEAVALFIARARAVRPDFQVTNANAPAVAEICVRLDGLPLAIELAAARSRILSPQAMLGQLEHRLDLLVGGARDLPARHRTLRAAIDWSYALLSPAEQRLLRQVAVFAGGWTLEAARSLCDGDVLAGLDALAENSLLLRLEQRDGSMRFRLLETVREYALQHLAENREETAARAAHAQFFLTWAEDAAPRLHGPDQKRWLDTLETEHNNLRAALQWALDSGEAESGLRLATALSLFWARRNHGREASSWFSALLGLPAAATRTLTRAKALTFAASSTAAHVGVERAAPLAEESVSICRELGNAQALARALHCLGQIAPMPLERRRALFQEGLALMKAAGDPVGMADLLHVLGEIAWVEDNDTVAARALYDEALAHARACGDKRRVCMLLTRLVALSAVCGDLQAMRTFGREALAFADELNDKAARMMVLGNVCGAEPPGVCIQMIDEAVAIARDLGQRQSTALYVAWAAEARYLNGFCDEAEPLAQEALALSRAIGFGMGEAIALLELGAVALLRGQIADALKTMRESLAVSLARRAGANARCVFSAILWLAVQAAIAEQWQRAALLLGAVDAHLTPTGYLWPAQAALVNKSRTAAREHLGEEAFAAAWATGHAMTIDQAGEYAMND